MVVSLLWRVPTRIIFCFLLWCCGSGWHIGVVVSFVSPFNWSSRAFVRCVISLGSPCYIAAAVIFPEIATTILQLGGPENMPALSVSGIFVVRVCVFFLCFWFQSREGKLNPFLTHVLVLERSRTWLNLRVMCPHTVTRFSSYVSSQCEYSTVVLRKESCSTVHISTCTTKRLLLFSRRLFCTTIVIAHQQ